MIDISDLDDEDLACLGMRRMSQRFEEFWGGPGVLRDSDAYYQSLPAPKAKRVRRLTIPQLENESGKPVTTVTEGPDGTRTYELREKVDTPFKIETPEQLRKLI